MNKSVRQELNNF